MAQSALTVTAKNPTYPSNVESGYANTGPATAGSLPPPNLDYPAMLVTEDPHKPWNWASQPPYLDDGAATNPDVFGAPASGPGSEGAGNETLATTTYPAGNGGQQQPPLKTVGCGPALTQNVMPQPNANHASYVNKAATFTNITPGSSVSGVGTTTLGVTGTNFRPGAYIVVNGVPQTTTYNSTTSLTAPSVTKKTSAGTWPVLVVSDGVQYGPVTWTFT